MNEPFLPLDVTIVTPQKMLFQGKAQSVVMPGEKGVFEILENHKPLLSRLIPGEIKIDRRSIPVHRGVVKVASNSVTGIVETTAGTRDGS